MNPKPPSLVVVPPGRGLSLCLAEAAGRFCGGSGPYFGGRISREVPVGVLDEVDAPPPVHRRYGPSAR